MCIFFGQTFYAGVKYLVPQVAGLLPINMPILVRLNRAVMAIISCSYEKKLLVAMFTVMYFTCLRIGEVAVFGHGEHILQINQISVNGTGNTASSFTIQFKSF